MCRIILLITFSPILFHEPSFRLLIFNGLVLILHCNHCHKTHLTYIVPTRFRHKKIASTIYPLILHLINLRSSPYQKLTSQLFLVINLGFLKVVSYITNMFLLLTTYICRIVVPFILRHKIFNLMHVTHVTGYIGEYKTL